ncbi:MAG: DUF4294 domain-containing protein [Dysgonamonadaceae bacterium]|jgi:hypothetical protein|nr:DUF4294 domain-containing protein [Dysgonamonadaceae bacterium]
MRYFFVLAALSLISAPSIKAQVQVKNIPEGYLPAYVEHGDTIAIVTMQEVLVFPPRVFKNGKQEQEYNKLVRDIKKTLPYAKLIYKTLIETYEYIETLPDDKARDEHLKRMESDLFNEYKPVLKKMTLSQGKLLIRLIDRECNQSSYELVKAFLGPFRAGWWNLFAGIFGASLKSEWKPTGKDAVAEQIIELVEKGIL